MSVISLSKTRLSFIPCYTLLCWCVFIVFIVSGEVLLAEHRGKNFDESPLGVKKPTKRDKHRMHRHVLNK